MRQRFLGILVVLAMLLNGEIFAQQIPHQTKRFSNESAKILSESFTCNKNEKITPKFFDLNGQNNFSDSKKFELSSSILSKNYYSTHLPFFCAAELQFEKVTKIPFRVRLGSVDYVEFLERKPNARLN